MPDDPSIPDDARLLRRIIPEWIVIDQNTHSIRVSSAAFSNSTAEDGTEEGMSVFIEGVLVNCGRSAASVLVEYQTNSLIAIRAGWVRSHQQGVVADPLPDEPAHAQVMGAKNSNTRRKLAKQYEWIVEPDYAK
jgi:hypothetical protein